MAFCFMGCEQEPGEVIVTGVKLSQESISLYESDCEDLTVTIIPDNATNKDVSWSSSDPSVASVQGGVITAHKAGSALITVETEDAGKMATCEVTVVAQAIRVENIFLNNESVTIAEGEDITLVATITPEKATNKLVTWSSSDDSVASVEDGKVKALKVGTTMITVRTEDGGKIATCEVCVVAKSVSVESVVLDHTAIEIQEGENVTVVATITPNDATHKGVVWSSSDPSVASVQGGVITAHKAGTAVITVETEDAGKTATCKVTVMEVPIHVESVFLNKTYIELFEGDEFSLIATVTPEKATNKSIVWSSGDNTIATVEDGKVKALNEGTTKIFVKTEDGGKIAMCELVVSSRYHPVQSISLDKTYVELKMGTSITLVATITPDFATNNNVTWISSDDVVAIVEDGKVTAMQEGTAIITAIAEDGGQTASCEVNVVLDIENGGGIEGTEDEDWDI